jgi:hypothetical protein
MIRTSIPDPVEKDGGVFGGEPSPQSDELGVLTILPAALKG